MAVKSGAVAVDGLRELRRFLRQLPDDVGKDGLKKIHDKVAEPVERSAVTKVPRRSGDLAASIRRAKGSATKAQVRAGKARVPYAGPIHFGWPARNIRAQPFLTDALADKRTVVLDMYTDELDRFIGQMMRVYQLNK